jgi:hypothetical protein
MPAISLRRRYLERSMGRCRTVRRSSGRRTSKRYSSSLIYIYISIYLIIKSKGFHPWSLSSRSGVHLLGNFIFSPIYLVLLQLSLVYFDKFFLPHITLVFDFLPLLNYSNLFSFVLRIRLQLEDYHTPIYFFSSH